MKIVLRDYQQTFYDEIWHKLYTENVVRLCAQLETGGGKSVVIAKLANDMPGRTLILTHRIEILKQNSDWLKDAGVLTSKQNDVMLSHQIVISMVQTLHSRIQKYGVGYLGEFDNIILDEVHVQIFQKVFEMYDYKRVVGFTATPVIDEKRTIEIDGKEYVQKLTLSETFDDIVCGITPEDLIQRGFLTQDVNIELQLPGFKDLVDSDSEIDGFTKKSLQSVYSSNASIDALKKAYYDYCVGKKTIVFNVNTEVSKSVYQALKEDGLNVKMFDSVNNKEINSETGNPYTRQETIEWFRNERDAVLVNVNVFTTGFDVGDVECIIMNRATKSLSLYIQIAGRGSRITDKILKDNFLFIDLGMNLREHGMWSQTRDWKSYFFPQPPKLKRKADMTETWDCKKCGAMNTFESLICSECGADKVNEPKEGSGKKERDGTFELYGKPPLPRGSLIIKYAISQGEGANFAFKVAENKMIELFRIYSVEKDFYLENEDRLKNRVRQIYLPIYHQIIKSDLIGSRKRLNTQLDKIYKLIDKIYDNHDRKR